MKAGQIADIQQAANVSLQVGGCVVGQPLARLQAAIVDSGIAAHPEQCVEVGRGVGEAADLREFQRQQLQQRSAAGKRLAHPRKQRQALGAGEHEVPRRWILIDDRLQVGGQLRCALDLVEDRAPAVEASQKGKRILAGKLTLGWGLQRDVDVAWEDRAGERRLP